MVECDDAVLVIAWGNPFREDDSVAWHVIEALRSLRPRKGLPPLHLRHAHQLTPEMAECVSRAPALVLVDARHDGTPGEVRSEVVPVADGGSSLLGHSLTPQTLLLYAEQLYGRAPRATLVTVTGERFGVGESLSPTVKRAIPRAVRTIIRQAREWTREPDSPASGRDPAHPTDPLSR